MGTGGGPGTYFFFIWIQIFFLFAWVRGSVVPGIYSRVLFASISGVFWILASIYSYSQNIGYIASTNAEYFGKIELKSAATTICSSIQLYASKGDMNCHRMAVQRPPGPRCTTLLCALRYRNVGGPAGPTIYICAAFRLHKMLHVSNEYG